MYIVIGLCSNQLYKIIFNFDTLKLPINFFEKKNNKFFFYKKTLQCNVNMLTLSKLLKSSNEKVKKDVG